MNRAERAGVTRSIPAHRHGGEARGSGREWFE
jgi:hypothetical protein